MIYGKTKGESAMKNFFLIFCMLFLSACATPVSYTNQPLQTYDKDTEYRIDDVETGFTINIYYSRYLFRFIRDSARFLILISTLNGRCPYLLI